MYVIIKLYNKYINYMLMFYINVDADILLL